MQPRSSRFTLAKMSTPDYYSVSNGPAATQYSEDSFITYCITSSFILLCALLLVIYFKDSILWTFSCIRDSIYRISFYVTHIFNTLYGLYTIWKELKQLQPQDQCFQQPKTGNPLVQISPPPDEFFTQVREQLIILIQTLPPLDEYLTEVREQLIIPSFTEQIPSIQDIQWDSSDSQVFETEHLLLLHTPHIFIEWTYPPWSFAMTEPSLNLFRERKDV